MASILNVDKIRAASGTTNVIDINSSCNTTALTIDSSGRTRIHQNNTATVSAPASGSLVLSGIPDWANKITLVTDALSPDTTGGFVRIRVSVGGSAVTTALYKYTEVRWQDGGTADLENNGGGINYIETVGFNNANNSHDYMFTFYRVDDYVYKFHGHQFNQYFSAYAFLYAGTITTTAAIDGFDIITATGGFDAGKARAFWE